MRWQSVNDALAAVLAILESPQDGLNDRLSSALADVVPHRALAVLAGDCARSPMSVTGEPAIAARITSADLARLAGTVSVGVPWQGVAPVAGEPRAVVAVAAAATAAPSLLVLVRRDEAAPDAQALLLVQRVWDLVGARLRHHIERADPAALAASRAAVAERTRVATGMTDAHEATLAALLGSLRAPDLSDAAARRVATDLAASALVDLRVVRRQRDRLHAGARGGGVRAPRGRAAAADPLQLRPARARRARERADPSPAPSPRPRARSCAAPC